MLARGVTPSLDKVCMGHMKRPIHTAMLKKLRTNPITDQKLFELIRTPVRTGVMSAVMQSETQTFPVA